MRFYSSGQDVLGLALGEAERGLIGSFNHRPFLLSEQCLRKLK
jgi:hypothetical protein